MGSYYLHLRTAIYRPLSGLQGRKNSNFTWLDYFSVSLHPAPPDIIVRGLLGILKDKPYNTALKCLIELGGNLLFKAVSNQTFPFQR